METTSQAVDDHIRPAGWKPRELPIVAGHLALDFANTVDDPLGAERWDHIADYAGLVAWAVRAGVVPEAAGRDLGYRAKARPGEAARVVRRAAELRNALNELFGAVVEDRSPAAGWAALRPFLTEAMENSGLERRAGPAGLTWDHRELASPLWPVAAAAAELATDPLLARVKRCAGCPWLFVDRSKNHSRRWCAMEDCGTHAKIVRYVRKRAAARRQL